MRKIYFLIASLTTFAAFAQPANDDCGNAIAVQINGDFNCGTVLSATLAGATASNVPDNGAGTPNDDVWFSFVATHTTHGFSILNIAGDQTDLVHEIMAGTCDGLTSINISDPESSVVSDLVIGNTYYIRVFNYYSTPATSTTFDLCVGSPSGPPANDDCENAIAVQVNSDYNCGTVHSATLAGATASDVPDNGAGTPSDDVWFSFVATNSTHRFSMLNRVGDQTDLVHEIMAGTCDGLVSINISDPESSVVSNLVVGNTYYIRVFNYYTTPAMTTTFDLCIGTPPAPPANDDCENAIELIPSVDTQCTTAVSGTLAGATASNVPDNGSGTPNDDVWYHFTATATTHFFSFTNLEGETTDMMHEVMSGDCGSLASIIIIDPETSVVSGLTVGETYYLRVFSWGSTPATNTTFDVCITTPIQLVNDECEDAVSLTVNADLNCGVMTAGTLTTATASDVPDNGAGTPDDDVWFSFVATSTSHRIELRDVIGSPTDLVHEVLGGTCDGLVSLSITDPNYSTVYGLTVGNTYYVRVFSYAANSSPVTSFNICVGTPPPPPANDDCANPVAIVPAETLAGSLVDGSVVGATPSASVPAPGCAGYTGGDVWYSVVIPADGNLIVETTASSTGITTFDSGMAVYSGTCGNLTLVACNDDGGQNNFSRISLTGRPAGEEIFIRVWEYNNDETEPFSVGAYSATLAAPSFDDAGFRAYPNPVSDVLNLSYTNRIDSVEVYNMIGQQVMARPVSSNEYSLNTSELPAGTYLVKVVSEGTSKTMKIVKQ